MKRAPWQTLALCLFVWVLLVGIPLCVFRGLVWITQLMEEAR